MDLAKHFLPQAAPDDDTLSSARGAKLLPLAGGPAHRKRDVAWHCADKDSPVLGQSRVTSLKPGIQDLYGYCGCSTFALRGSVPVTSGSDSEDEEVSIIVVLDLCRVVLCAIHTRNYGPIGYVVTGVTA